MIGFGQCDSVWWNRYGSRIWRSSPPSFSQFTSPPAQNAFSPAPVRTTTPTSGSAPALSMAIVISRRVSPVNALYCFGRLIVTRATWSRTSYRRSRYAIPVSASSGVRDDRARNYCIEFSERSKHLGALHARQVDVEHDEIRPPSEHRAESLGAIRHPLHLIAPG